MVYNINAAMADALRHLERVSNHLRRHDQNEAANQIGRLSIMIAQAVEAGMMYIPVDQHVIPLADNQVVPAPTSSAGHQAMSPYHPRDHINQQAHAALMREVNKEQIQPAHTETRSLQKLGIERRALEPRTLAPRLAEDRAVGKMPARTELAVQPESWAQVASSTQLQAVSPFTPGHPGDTAQFMSPVSMTVTSISDSKIVHVSDEGNTEGEAALSPTSQPDPPLEEKAGVIRVHGRISKESIGFITTRIHEGPLQEIRVESNGRARVVFQFLSHALAFFKSDRDMTDKLGFGRLGQGHTIEMAEVVDWNDDLRLMNQPIRERRRLSFARKGLFSGHLTADRWKHDMQSIAGSTNIDIIWVFNSGNATAVFTSTIIARKVLENVNRWKVERFPYYGVSVTYSSDPCEKELVLTKEDKPRGGHAYRRRR